MKLSTLETINKLLKDRHHWVAQRKYVSGAKSVNDLLARIKTSVFSEHPSIELARVVVVATLTNHADEAIALIDGQLRELGVEELDGIGAE